MQSTARDAYSCVQHGGASLIFGRVEQVSYDGMCWDYKPRPERSHSLIHEPVVSPQVDSNFSCGPTRPPFARELMELSLYHGGTNESIKDRWPKTFYNFVTSPSKKIGIFLFLHFFKLVKMLFVILGENCVLIQGLCLLGAQENIQSN